jgi:hypothetical protein
MKPLDPLEQFDKASSTIAFVATYEFNPQFFERRILTKRTYVPGARRRLHGSRTVSRSA